MRLKTDLSLFVDTELEHSRKSSETSMVTADVDDVVFLSHSLVSHGG